MADSSTERSRRRRAHARGDHVLCDPARCHALPESLAELDPPVEVGATEAALRLFVDTLDVPPGDARSVIAQAGLELAHLVDSGQGQAVAAARELRQYVGWMREFGEQGDGLDKVRAQRALRRVDSFLSTAGDGPVGLPGEHYVLEGPDALQGLGDESA